MNAYTGQHVRKRFRLWQHRDLTRAALILTLLVLSIFRADIATAQDQIRVSYLPVLDVVPLFVGIEKGFFKDEGVSVIPTPNSGAAAGIPGLMSGAFDMMYSNVVSTMLASQQNFDLKIVAAGTQKMPLAEVSSGLVARAGESIKTGKDLEGKVIATNTRNNIIWLYARAWVEKTGGDSSKVRFKEVAFPQMADALRKKQVDAAFIIDPFFHASLSEKETFEFVDDPYRPVQPDLEIGHYVSLSAYLTKNAEAVAKFNRAMRKAVAWYNANRTSSEVANIISGYTKMKPELVNKNGLPEMRDRIEISTLERSVELMKEAELVSSPIDVRALVIPEIRQ